MNSICAKFGGKGKNQRKQTRGSIQKREKNIIFRKKS